MGRTPLTSETARPPSRTYVVISIMLGVIIWLAVGGGVRQWQEQLPDLAAVLIGVGVLLIPMVRRIIAELFEKIDRPAPRARAIAAWGAAVAAAIYFAATALQQDRYLHPAWHDEFSYLTQMQMVARGRLWMPEHPIADSFESFYLLSRPVYASMYFPGTAMLYAPAVWLHLPTWILPVVAAGAVVGLLYRITAELIDGSSAAVAVLMAIALGSLRMLSTMIMSQIPVLLLGLLATWAWLRWRQQRRARWALFIGIFVGWAAITRPLDAICFAAPIGLAILLPVRGQTARLKFVSLAMVFAGAVPFLTIQLIADKGITGHWFTTPWTYYVDRDFPQTGMGFREFDPTRRPVSQLPQKQMFYARHIALVMSTHETGDLPRAWLMRRWPVFLEGTLPQTLMVIVAVAGLSSWRSRQRWVIAAVAPLFLLLYVFSAFFLNYYPVTAMAGMILAALLGVEAIADPWPKRRHIVRPVLLGALMLLSIMALPQAMRSVGDQRFDPTLLRAVDQYERSLPDAPAVILFLFSPTRNLNEEPVYNASVAWPDDARIIRAHHLGERNRLIVDYFAQRQPDRRFYMFDEGSMTGRYLGTAGELQAQLRTAGGG